MRNTVKLVILLILILICCAVITYQKNIIEGINHNMSVMADSLVTYKDKNGNQVAKIKSLETDNIKNIKALQTSDSMILLLKGIIIDHKKNLRDRGSATIFKSITKIDTFFVPQIHYQDSNAVYSSNFNLDNWVIGNVLAKKDTLRLDIIVKNDYSIIVGEEKNGIFKRKTPFAKVTNYNPYSETIELKSYQVKLPKKDKIHLGPVIALDPISANVSLSVGISYSLLSF